MSYFIGIDGGGTGCRVAVARAQGPVLGRAEGGAANIASDFESARANILSTTLHALENAGLSERALPQARAVLGLAGANLGDCGVRLLAALPFGQARVLSDAQTALVGALGDQDGVIAALGTGSVYARQSGGVFTQLGGWGFMLGDDGSGARLGRDLLHRTLLAHDGVLPHSDLTRETLARFGNAPRQVVAEAKAFTPRDFGQLAPRVVAAARAGDSHGEAIMAAHTEIVRKSLDAVGFAPGRGFAMLGGLGPVFLARLPARYRNAASQPLGNALDGALALARKGADES